MTSPLNIRQLVQLASDHIVLSNVTMESDKFIVCREKEDNTEFGAVWTRVNIVDVADPINVARLPVHAESIIMHPRRPIFATRTLKKLQIFDVIFTKTSRIKKHTHNEEIVFWRWIDDSTIVFVTKSAVFHWTLPGMAPPQKLYSVDLTGCKVIDYKSSANGKLCYLTWHTKTDDRLVFKSLVYDREKHTTTAIDGQAVGFLEHTLPGRTSPSDLLVYVTRKCPGGQLNITEFGPPPTVDTPSHHKSTELPKALLGGFSEFADDFTETSSSSQGVVYLSTKYGHLHVFDAESALEIYSGRYSDSNVLTTTERTEGGFLAINAKGQVISVSLDVKRTLDHISEVHPKLAHKLAVRWNSEDLIHSSLNTKGGEKVSVPSLPPAYIPPPSYASLEQNDQINESIERAVQAERERDQLAAQLAEMKIKYEEALLKLGEGK